MQQLTDGTRYDLTLFDAARADGDLLLVFVVDRGPCRRRKITHRLSRKRPEEARAFLRALGLDGVPKEQFWDELKARIRRARLSAVLQSELYGWVEDMRLWEPARADGSYPKLKRVLRLVDPQPPTGQPDLVLPVGFRERRKLRHAA